MVDCGSTRDYEKDFQRAGGFILVNALSLAEMAATYCMATACKATGGAGHTALDGIESAYGAASRDFAAASAVRTFGQFSAAEIRIAAATIDRNGLPQVGRALQKHSDRAGSVFAGLSSGNVTARNAHGMRVLDDILEDPSSTAQVLDNVVNIWDSTGRGVRLKNDGTFMGFLEPLK